MKAPNYTGVRPATQPDRVCAGSRGLSRAGGEDTLVQDGNVREVAIVPVEIKAVADDEFIRDVKADVVRVDDGGRGDFLLEENTGFDVNGTLVEQEFSDRAEGAAGVENIIDDQHILPLHVESG